MKPPPAHCEACSGRRVVVCATCDGSGVSTPGTSDSSPSPASRPALIEPLLAELDRMAAADAATAAIVAEAMGLSGDVRAFGNMGDLVRSLSDEQRRLLSSHLADDGQTSP